MYSSFFREPRPFVIMLGWLGSKQRYFEKYVEMWRGLGGFPIGIRPTILQTAVPAFADHALLRFLADLNQAYGSHCLAHGGAQPIMVHTFSNAGFLAFGTMLHLASLLDALMPPAASAELQLQQASLMDSDAPLLTPSSAASTISTQIWATSRHGLQRQGQQQGQRQGSWGAGSIAERHPYLGRPEALATLAAFRQALGHAAGIVIDSAPSQPDPCIWARGVLSAALGKPAASIESSYPLAVRALRGLSSTYLHLKPVAQRYAEIQQAWAGAAPACPQLYLYSEADVLIPAEDVRAFMRSQKARGVTVQSHCWEETAHCEHYRSHPEEYTRLVSDFTQLCTWRAGKGQQHGAAAPAAFG